MGGARIFAVWGSVGAEPRHWGQKEGTIVQCADVGNRLTVVSDKVNVNVNLIVF